jgi:hypothetical protein
VALTAATSNYTTYDTLTALSVSGMINAVIHGGDLLKKSGIRQIADSRLEVTGGVMSAIGGRTYLVFGQAFQGGYIPTGHSTTTFTQIYSDEIRSFNIVYTPTSLAIKNYQALRDSTNFRRRDGNMNQVVLPDGRYAIGYYGGVFTPGNNSTAYGAPILIGPTAKATVDSNYQQYFDQYATTTIPLYDAASRAMDTIFVGGISVYSYANGQFTFNPPGIPGAAWVDNVTTLERRKNGSDQEFIMASLPGNYGAYSAFLANPFVPQYANGVIELDKLKGPTIIGYVYGGIYSTVAQTSPNPAIEATQTGASNQVFEVVVTPT